MITLGTIFKSWFYPENYEVTRKKIQAAIDAADLEGDFVHGKQLEKRMRSLDAKELFRKRIERELKAGLDPYES